MFLNTSKNATFVKLSTIDGGNELELTEIAI